MVSRRKFINNSGFASASLLFATSIVVANDNDHFDGLIVHEEEGEEYRLRNGDAVVKIKVSKEHGSASISFLASTLPPGDVIRVHKHLNEDEILFLHKGSGVFTLGEKEYEVKQGSVLMVPRNVWHGLRNNGNETIHLRFAYTPSGFEGFFREIGTPPGKAFVKKTPEQRRTIAKKWGMITKD